MREHLLMNFFDWLRALAQDSDPAKQGFQPYSLYVVWNVVFPLIFGITVAVLTGLAGKVFSLASRKRSD